MTLGIVAGQVLAALVSAIAPLAPRVVSVENGGLLFTDNQAGVSGTDAGYSVPMGAQTLWLFGDVFLLHPSDPARQYVGAVSNCALLTGRGHGAAPLSKYQFLVDPATGLARQVIPTQEDEGPETRLWPLGGWHDAGTVSVYLYYALVRVTGPGPFGFEIAGHGLARADASRPRELMFQRLRAPSGQWVWWPSAGPMFGCAVFAGADEDDEHLYLVGVPERDPTKPGKLARVPRSRITELDAYEYFVGTSDRPRWRRRPDQASSVEGLGGFPNELSVSYNAYLGGYLAVHSVGIAERIALALAPAPWGPYRLIAEVGAPHRALESAFCYAAKEHPELAEDGGRVIYVTYVDSQRYWLQLLKVTLAR